MSQETRAKKLMFTWFFLVTAIHSSDVFGRQGKREKEFAHFSPNTCHFLLMRGDQPLSRI